MGIRLLEKAVEVFRLVWMERLAYRVNFFLEIASGILSSLIVVFLWLAAYRSRGGQAIGGYSVSEMVTYLLGAGLINSFVQTAAESQETSQSIQDGTLSNILLKPIHPYGIWFVRDMGSKAFFVLVGLTGYLAVFLIFREYLVRPASLIRLLLFPLSILLAALLQFFLFEGLSLLSFWLENTSGIRFMMRVVMEVLGGAIIPVTFFPQALQGLFFSLPFPFLLYLPMSVYLGKMPMDQACFMLLKEVGWIAVLAGLNVLIWRRGIHQYVSMGD